MFLQPKHLKKKKKKNLLDAAVTDRGCWRENERLYGPTHQAYHRRSQTIQTVWIHPSSLTQTTKRGTGKSWMGRGHRVTGTLAVAFRQCFSHFSMKSRLLDVRRTNYAPSFTRWNTKLLTCLLTHSLKQSRPDAFHFQWSSSFSQTFPLRLSESNNELWLTETGKASCGVQSVSSIQRYARCIVGTTRDFPDLKINTNSCFGAFWRLMHAYGRRLMDSSKSGVAAISLQLYLLTMYNHGPWPFFWPLKYSFSFQKYSLCW